MSGVPVHTQSPINAAKASGVAPQTAYIPPSSTGVTPTTTASATHEYPPAKPGQVAPTPTATRALNPRYEPPAPQPGSVPSASTARTTSRPSLPPPPKTGELPKPSEFYAPSKAVPTIPAQPISYPQQMMLPTPGTSIGQPPASTTSTSVTPSFSPIATLPTASRTEPTSTNPHYPFGGGGSNLQHPPGYIQNPYASDMTPDQRFATEQVDRLEESQTLGHNESTRKNNSTFGVDNSVWDMTKKWVKGAGDSVGGYVTEMNEKISRNLDNSK